MANLVVATVPLTGHVQPMALLVRELVARGHAVRWYAAGKFAATVAAAGATFAPMRTDWCDDDVEPLLRGRRGLGRVKLQLREMFISPAVAQVRDLDELAAAEPPDAVIADAAHLGAALWCEKRGVPHAGLGISALMLRSADTAPFGSALPPARASRFLDWLIFRVLFRGTNRAYRRARAAVGLEPGTGTYFDVVSPQLFLQPTVPAFEYPRRDLPPHVHFIGPLVPRGVARAVLPWWWGDIEAAVRRRVPIVLVTQGTLATDPRALIEPALRGLSREPVLVIATTAGATLDASLPDNARIATYVPYEALLPYAAAMITNGGYGGVQMALAHGVPLVVAGGSEEKPEIAARVQWSGAGKDLRTGHPRATSVRNAVRAVLDDPRYRSRAQEIARDMAAHDAVREGAALIEDLVARRAPIEAQHA